VFAGMCGKTVMWGGLRASFVGMCGETVGLGSLGASFVGLCGETVGVSRPGAAVCGHVREDGGGVGGWGRRFGAGAERRRVGEATQWGRR
jgi:hypothetical protein